MKIAALSLILPGLGQLAQGKRANGLALISACFGMLAWIWIDASKLTLFFIVCAYLSLVFHAFKDALNNTRNTGSIQYVLGLAVVVGPFALPLLWQNQQASQRIKLIWSTVILALTALMILSMIYLDPILEKSLNQITAGQYGY